MSSLFVEESDYSAIFRSGANNLLAFWLYFVVSSYFLLNKKVKFFSSSVKPEEKVFLYNKNIPNERTDNVNDALCYSESLGSPNSTCSSTSYDIFSEISDFNRTSYCHSLLNLVDEDSAWLSDSIISEDPSSPLSCNGDYETEPDIGTPSYWDSLLKLDEQDNEWISSSKQGMECVQDDSPIASYKINWGTEIHPSVSTISSFTGAREDSEDIFSAEHLLETADIEELSGDEPLFWPSEGELSWDSDESSLCCSPRKRLVFDSGLKTSRIKGCEQKSFEDFDSDMDIPLEYFDLDLF